MVRNYMFVCRRLRLINLIIFLCIGFALLICGIVYKKLDLSNNRMDLTGNTYSQLINYLDTFFPESDSNNKEDKAVSNTDDSYPLKEMEELVDYNSILQRLQTPLYNQTMNTSQMEEKVKANFKLYDRILSQPIIEPNVDDLVRPGTPLAGKANATILSLVQNKDINAIISTIKQLEDTFNSKFGYPYTFMNDEEFSDNFKQKILEMLPEDRVTHFVKINPDDWNRPEDIDVAKYDEAMDKLEAEKVQYSKKLSYHNMCRFYSSKFYHQDILKNYKYAWRIEPNVNFYCKIDYDIFQFMEQHDKIYGFTLNLYDSPQSVRTLWESTFEFIKENPHYLNNNGAFEWIKENLQKPWNFNVTNGYSTCHFWTNFEINNLDFLRSEPYERYMEHLESKGGFYYERWGDAPVRSLALALFADKSRIHWFRDIAYHHFPYTNCPKSPLDSNRCNGNCVAGKFSPYPNLNIENCMPTWLEYSMTEDQLKLYEIDKD